MATIADVAKHAGVSMMTVSRVINNSGSVSEATRQKVEASIKQLGYRPNMVARSLVTNRTRMIAYVASNFANPYFAEVTKGIYTLSRERGYLAVLYDVSGAWQVDACLNMLIDQRIDGVVFHHLDITQAQVAMLARRGVRCVTIDNERDLDGVTTIESDNYGGARAATRLLIERGHTRVGCIHGHYADSNAGDIENIEYTETFQRRIWRDRTRGFLDEMRDAGLAPACLVEGRGSAHYSMVTGSFSIAKMIDSGGLPTAFYCENDLMALGALGSCLESRVHVPRQVAIVGHDGLEISQVLFPRVTTIRQPRYTTGRLAAEKLIDAIEKDVRPERLMTQFDVFMGDTV